MAREVYAAITGEEMGKISILPQNIAYLGTHFEGNTLVDIPEALPEGSLLLIDDRVIPENVSIDLVIVSLSHLFPCLSGIYLDFQQEDTPKDLVHSLLKALPVPVGVPRRFGLGIPVVPPRRLSMLPEKHYLPGCWAEGAVSAWELTLTKDGCTKKEVSAKESAYEEYSKLFCRYAVENDAEKAVFHLQNNRELLHREIAGNPSVDKWIVLYRDWVEETN